MSLLDTLRKLGILRFGAKAATYKNGTDRPMEFMMDGVFNAEKDLTNIKKLGSKPPQNNPPPPPIPKGCPKCSAPIKPGASFCTACGNQLHPTA